MSSSATSHGSRSITRKDLTLKQKYELIQQSKDLKAQELAALFGCGKTQVYSVLKNKAKITEIYESNLRSNASLLTRRKRKSPNGELNDLLYEWYQLALRKNVVPDGPTLMEQAKAIAQRLGIDGFKASNGWLHKWKVSHNLKCRTVSGESGEVSEMTTQSWKERLPEILEGYSEENIFNMDETGCFWQALPEKGFAKKGETCKGGKKSKLRITIAFFVNACGEKEFKPVVIWKSKTPRCFKRVDINQLPVLYYNQPKAWMTSDIMHSILTKLNMQMKAQGRSILLLLDGAGCHPNDLASPGRYSNIKVIFLPPNTTSVLQPLDLGIIKNFKVHYRQLLLRYVCAQIEECSTANEIIKSVTVLNAIRWVAEAWKMVSATTIRKCFRKAGILDQDFSVVKRANSPDHDPFEDLDEESDTSDLQALICQVQGENACSAEEFVNGDGELQTCVNIYGDEWREEFFDQLSGPSPKSPNTDVTPGISDDEIEEEEQRHEPRLKYFKEVIQCLEDVLGFLDHRRHTMEVNQASQLLVSVNVLCINSKSWKQMCVTDYFRK